MRVRRAAAGRKPASAIGIGCSAGTVRPHCRRRALRRAPRSAGPKTTRGARRPSRAPPLRAGAARPRAARGPFCSRRSRRGAPRARRAASARSTGVRFRGNAEHPQRACRPRARRTRPGRPHRAGGRAPARLRRRRARPGARATSPAARRAGSPAWARRARCPASVSRDCTPNTGQPTLARTAWPSSRAERFAVCSANVVAADRARADLRRRAARMPPRGTAARS